MSLELDRLYNQLITVLVKMDQAENRRHPNIYRMGLLLEAAQKAKEEATDLIHDGQDVNTAFGTAVAHNFTVSRRIHTFLKKVDPTIDVQYGSWTRKR
jgi:hypothetical protein